MHPRPRSVSVGLLPAACNLRLVLSRYSINTCANVVELLTDESKEHCRLVDDVVMDSNHLHLLSTAVQSDTCAKALKDSNLLRVLSHAIHEFCLSELQSVPSSQSPLRISMSTSHQSQHNYSRIKTQGDVGWLVFMFHMMLCVFEM